MKTVIAFHLLSLSLFSVYGISEESMVCAFTKEFVCFPDGCSPTKDQPGFLIVPTLENESGVREIQKCHSNQCISISTMSLEPYKNPAGTFAIMTGQLASDMGGYFLKVQTEEPSKAQLAKYPKMMKRGDFVQVSSIGSIIFVSYGNCPLPEVDPESSP